MAKIPDVSLGFELRRIAKSLSVNPDQALLLYHDTEVRTDGVDEPYVEQEVDDVGTKLVLTAEQAASHKRNQNNKRAREGRLVLKAGAKVDAWLRPDTRCFLDPSYIEMSQVPGNQVTLFPLIDGWNAVPVHSAHIQFTATIQLVDELNEVE